MNKIISVEPLENYTVRLKFADGIEGTVDLSELVGKGVFSAWENIDFFKSVFIDKETHTIAWDGGIDLCPDNLYSEVTGAEPLEIFKKEKTAAL